LNDTDNHNVLNVCTSTEQNSSSSSNASDILLHKSLSSNDLTNIDFAKEDEHKLTTDFATFEKHTNISFQSCTTNISSSDHGTIEETFKSALTEWAVSERISLSSTGKLLQVLPSLHNVLPTDPRTFENTSYIMRETDELRLILLLRNCKLIEYTSN